MSHEEDLNRAREKLYQYAPFLRPKPAGFCRYCNYQNKPDTKYCNKCGRQLPETTDEPPQKEVTPGKYLPSVSKPPQSPENRVEKPQYLRAPWPSGTELGTAGNQTVCLSEHNRTQGIAVIGKNGTGKSSLIRAIFNQEVQQSGATLLLFDPHGDLADSLLKSGQKEIVWLRPEVTSPFGLNLFDGDPADYEKVERTVNVTIEIFKKIIGQDTSFMPRFEYIFGSLARTILYSFDNLTLAEVPLLLTDLQFSRNIARNLENPALIRFWQDYERSFWDKSGKVARPYDQFMYLESVSNRINTLLQNELLYRIVSQSRSTIRFDELLESGKAIVFSLPMGRLGSGCTALLGSILLAKCAEAIYQRGMNQRRVHLYVDEYGQYFATPFTADLLTQGRKYNVSTLVSLQVLDQIEDEKNKAAVLNAGNTIVFSVVGKDADTLSKQFALPDALPEKPDVMAPYILSPTPVEDIWRKGHNSPHVMEIRDNLFILLHQMEIHPYEKVFFCPDIDKEDGKVLQGMFTDMDNYCTNREQIAEAFNKLNECLVGCQSYTGGSFDFRDWMDKLFVAFLLLRGYMGFYSQNRRDTEGEYGEWVEERVRKGVMDPRRLEQDYEWKLLAMKKSEVDSLWEMFILDMNPDTPIEAYKAAAEKYGRNRTLTLLRSFPTETQLLNLRAMNWRHPSEEEKMHMYIKRFSWEMMNLFRWCKRFLLAINDLSVMPVMTQSSTYAGQRTDRPIGDMKEELSMRLATLPNYTALCNLLQDDGTIQTVQIRTLKG